MAILVSYTKNDKVSSFDVVKVVRRSKSTKEPRVLLVKPNHIAETHHLFKEKTYTVKILSSPNIQGWKYLINYDGAWWDYCQVWLMETNKDY